MIAPEPALAGPRPAAKPREAARGPEPETAPGGDFDSVLKERPDKAEAPAAVVPDAVSETPAAEMVVAALGVAPMAPPPVAPAVAPAEDGTVAEAAPGIPAARAAAPMPVELPALALAAAGAAPPARADGVVVSRDAGDAAIGKAPAVPAPATAPGDVPARPEVTAAVPVERREAAEVPADPAPRREEVQAGRAPAPAAAPAAPVVSEAPAALRDAAAPAWHLAADPGQGPARLEAVAAFHPAPAPAPAPLAQAQAVVGQLAVAVGRASDDKVEIRLDPPELGRVQIHLTRTDGGVQAVVLADRPETQDLLRRHAEELARELGQAGYDSVSLDFGGGEARAGREGAAMDWFEEAPAAPAPAASAPAPVAAPRRSLAGGLDIRL